jgi:2-polyprenyl-6-methoxyphenol hydroxylase-like FAD-dependent oxidoreductase
VRVLDLRVLISGAGIAGPAVAFWLARYGAAVTVVESAPALRAGGQLVDIRGAAREVIARAGLADTILAGRTAAEGLSFVDSAGRRQASVPATGFGGDGPVAEIEILRGALSEIFYDASRESVEYVFGERIVRMDERPGGVDVDFEHGRSRTFDAVIGADGQHSGVRGLLFGPDQVQLRHLGVYLSFWTAENLPGLRDWTEIYSEPGRTVGARAIRDSAAVMAFLSFRSAPLDHDHRDQAALKAVVRSRAAGMGWYAEPLVAQLEDAPDFYFDACSQVILPRWSAGRIGLVGGAGQCS